MCSFAGATPLSAQTGGNASPRPSDARLQAIHPFIDGNGRMGRLLITLLLVDWGLLPLPLLYLSAYFDRRRDRYCDSLQSVSEYGSWPDWLAEFLIPSASQARRPAQRGCNRDMGCLLALGFVLVL